MSWYRKALVLGLGGACLLAAAIGPTAAVALGAEAASPAPALRIDGALPQPLDLSLASLAARPSSEIEWGHGGQTNRYRGISLASLLEELGIEPGAGGDELAKAVKHAGLRLVIVATAADGFQAVFSYAELASELGPTKAWLVWEMDNQPLPAAMAPLRILVPTDAGADRCIYQVNRLTAIDAGKLAAAATGS